MLEFRFYILPVFPREEVADKIMEFLKRFVVLVFHNFLLEELPESFNKTQVWKIGGT